MSADQCLTQVHALGVFFYIGESDAVLCGSHCHSSRYDGARGSEERKKERKKERTSGSLESCRYVPSASLSQHLNTLVSYANARTEGQGLIMASDAFLAEI